MITYNFIKQNKKKYDDGSNNELICHIHKFIFIFKVSPKKKTNKQ